MPAEQKVTVVVEDEHQPRIDDVAEELRREGMHVDAVHPLTGTILGSVTGERLQAVRKVAGVKSVQPQRGFRIAPPDADVQ
jgi:hypothetical protein